jgi:hypothetical protein
VPNVSPPDDAEFARRWEELAQQLSAELPETADAAPPLPPELAQADGAGQPGAGGSGAGATGDQVDGADWADGADWPGAGGAGVTGVSGPRDWEPAEVEEHFVPPDPGPITQGVDPLIVVAWCAIGIALIGLGWNYVLTPHWDPLIPKALVVVLALGVAALVWRMPHHRDPDETDNGAQV